MPILWLKDTLQAKKNLDKGEGALRFSATIIAEDKNQFIYRSFAPEMDKARQDRSSLELSREGDNAVFKITAEDAVAFRASLNAVSSMLAVICKMMVI